MDIHRVAKPFMLHFRKSRMKLFQQLFDIGTAGFIIDVGGNSFNWQFVEKRPAIVLVNLAPEHFGSEASAPGFLRVVADGRRLPFRDGAVRVLFCNSVIEHLGTPQNQREFAAEIERVATSYFVQTPDRRFPVEPHFLTPLFHFLPRPLRRVLARNFTVWGLLTRPSRAAAESIVEEIRLLGPNQVKALFPTARILSEKLAGWPKSIIAVRTP